MQNQGAVAITFTNGESEGKTLQTLSLYGQASVPGCAFGSSCAFTSLNTRVTALALFDEQGNQVGLSKAIDDQGNAVITNLNLHIPPSMSVTLIARMSLSSKASDSVPFDQVSIGVNSTGTVAVNDSGLPAYTETQPSLITQTSSKPTVAHTILSKGTLTIQAGKHPATALVVAGKNAWQIFAEYKATAQYEDGLIDRLAELMSSPWPFDAADFKEVAVAVGGKIVGQAAMSKTGMVDVDLSQFPITVPKDGSVSFQLWAKIPQVVAWSTAPAPTGNPRSGHAPGLGLAADLMVDEWDAKYAGMLNVRSVGASSGEYLFAAKGAAAGNPMVLRKSIPIVTKQSLASNKIANLEQDTYRLQVAADGAGPIALKQLPFRGTKSPEVNLSSFRLRRGNLDLDPKTYGITLFEPNASGQDVVVKDGFMEGTGQGTEKFSLVVTFMQEETILGNGNLYTLHETISGANQGSFLLTGIDSDAKTPLRTGYLEFAFGYTPKHPVFTVSPNKTGGDGLGLFICSDLSEVLHNTQIGMLGGTPDWFHGFLVQDLTQNQLLSQ